MAKRVAYFDGPGDALESFSSWSSGRADTPGVTHVPFSRQLFDACDARDIELLHLASNLKKGRASHGRISVMHIGDASIGRSGIGYHLGQLVQACSVMWKVIRFRADALVTKMFPYVFLLSILRLFGVRIFMESHNTLWARGSSPHQRSSSLLEKSMGWFLRHIASGALCVSREIRLQLTTVSGATHLAFVEFLPSFRREHFPPAPMRNGNGTFRALYIGRVERDKGVMNLVEMADQLARRKTQEWTFQVCGNGSASAALESEVTARGLGAAIKLSGWCTGAQVRQALADADITIVPTTNSFAEGFNMVVVESLLAGRPVLVSTACPAIDYLRGGYMEVEAMDVPAYTSALRDFSTNESLRNTLASGVALVRETFFHDSNAFTYESAIGTVLDSVLADAPLKERLIPR